jgi:hypothetical protein
MTLPRRVRRGRLAIIVAAVMAPVVAFGADQLLHRLLRTG